MRFFFLPGFFCLLIFLSPSFSLGAVATSGSQSIRSPADTPPSLQRSVRGFGAVNSDGQGGREFGTRIGVEVAEGAVWRKQELLLPRIPERWALARAKIRSILLG